MTPSSGSSTDPEEVAMTDDSGVPIPLRVSVTVGDLYMLLAWADEGLRGGASPEAHPRARQIIDSVRADMNTVCDAAITQAAKEVRDAQQ